MKSLFSLFLISLSLSAVSQEKEVAPFPLEGPSDWRKEIISLPLSFAPELDYTGTEYVLFAKGWSNKEATDFWTYTFAWVLEDEVQFNEKQLNTDLKNYFDGLMKVVGGDKIPKEQRNSTVAKLKKDKSELFFEGQVHLFDAFFLKDTITLNVRVRPTYCAESKKQIIYFRYSPVAFDAALWDTMKHITIPCE